MLFYVDLLFSIINVPYTTNQIDVEPAYKVVLLMKDLNNCLPH